MLAAGDTIRITVRGRGGHASTPHLAADPITVAAEIVIALQTMVTRTIHAFDPAVLTIAQLVAGTTTNIIPETATIAGTVRTVSEETREAVRAGIGQVAAGVAAAHGVGAEVELTPGYPVTYNDDAAADTLAAVAREVGGDDVVSTMDYPVMGSEDFSYSSSGCRVRSRSSAGGRRAWTRRRRPRTIRTGWSSTRKPWPWVWPSTPARGSADSPPEARQRPAAPAPRTPSPASAAGRQAARTGQTASGPGPQDQQRAWNGEDERGHGPIEAIEAREPRRAERERAIGGRGHENTGRRAVGGR